MVLHESFEALQKRYEILLKISEDNASSSAAQIKSISDELISVTAEKRHAQKAVEELKQQVSAKAAELEIERNERAAGAERVKALEAELDGVKAERDARAQEKEEAQKAVEELKQQVSAKAAELEIERKERAAGAERVKALEGELDGVKAERDAQEKDKEATREDADLTLLQLHQVQEEVEHYFLLSRLQANMLSTSEKLSKRASTLISKMI